MKFELKMKKLFKKIVSGLAPPDDENPRNTSTCQQQSAPLGDAHLLPILWPLKKNAQPWNMSWHKFPDRISCDGTVLRFQFVPGVFGLKSGCAFRANPFRSLPADSCMFRYSVYFPPEFNWVKGGKLPGVNFGTAPNKCSTGGDWCCDSGSFRIMFRQNGDAIGYAYMALPGGGPGSFAAQRPEVQAVSKVEGETNRIALCHYRMSLLRVVDRGHHAAIGLSRPIDQGGPNSSQCAALGVLPSLDRLRPVVDTGAIQI